MNALTVPNGVAVALFGIALSAAFCDIHWTKKNCIILAVSSAAMLLMQALITYKGSWMAMAGGVSAYHPSAACHHPQRPQRKMALAHHLGAGCVSVLSAPALGGAAGHCDGAGYRLGCSPPSRWWSRCRCWRYCCAMLHRRPAALPGIRARCSFCSA